MSRRLVCGRCPKWRRGVSVCLFRGVVMLEDRPVCDHGRLFIKREASRLWMAKNAKTKKEAR